MPLNRRIFASVQLALREALMLCSLPKQRHSMCFCSLQQSRSFFSSLSGMVLDFLGPMDVCEPLSETCHDEVRLHSFADWSSNSTFQLLGVSDLRLSDRLLFFHELHTWKLRRVGIVQASVVVILIHGLENVNGVCCVLCLCRQTPLAQSTMFSAAPVKNDRSAINACRRCQLATRVGVARTLFHLGSPHAAVLLLGISGLAR